jgi:hypothetical protein
LHLALTHVPVILVLAGVGMLIVALFLKSNTLVKASYVIIAVAGIAALPVYFSGEGAEEAVEHLPGVSGNVIERHENVAKAGFIAILAAGLLSLAALFSFRFLIPARLFKAIVLGAGLISAGFMFQAAKLGGEIRHTEINHATAGLNSQDISEKGGEGNNNSEEEDD